MPLNRRQLAQLYRPTGPKPVSLGNPANAGTAGAGTTTVGSGAIDLSLPLRGLRLVYKGRIAVGTAGFSSNSPEGILNGISNIKLTGTNARQGGNVTLYDIDLPTLFTMQHMFERRQGIYTINGTQVAIPSTPFPAGWNPFANTGNYDFNIVFDLPFSPFGAGPGVQPGFLVRQEEWKDSLQLIVTYGSQAGNAAGAFGTAAATTTVAFTANGGATGTPSLDVYSLPVIMGNDLKNRTVPGFVTRVQQPVTAPFTSAGTGIQLLAMQKQNTGRVFAKAGTSAVNPTFATLSDTAVTQLGISLGGNRSVRNKVDIFAHKESVCENYETDPIQGYTCLDFLQSGNPRSGYPGDRIGDGASFQLVGDTASVTNGFAILVQEQMLYAPEGDLYSL